MIKSLDERPNKSWLKRINECEDEKVLKHILKDSEKLSLFNNENELKLLWECCQIPDFSKKTYGNHIEIVGKVFNFLREKPGKISNNYMKEQLALVDKMDGNVDSISNRIANVRTWAYVSNKSNWVENQDYWIERTKYIEDKLSDRLHEELTKSFIDERASVLARGLKQDITFHTKIENEEKVLINNQYIGTLKALKLDLDLKTGALETDIKSLKKAARQNVSPEINRRINDIINNQLIELKDDFKIYWGKFPIAKLLPGVDYLNPGFNLIIDDMIDTSDQKKLSDFLEKWILEKINNELKNLMDLKYLKQKNPQIRALAYHLYENNGVVKREEVTDFLKKISQDDRKILRELGVKFGRYHIFLFKMFKPSIVSFRILLWKNYNQVNLKFKPPTFGLNFLESKDIKDKNIMLLSGFEKFDRFFVRIDILERLFIKLYNFQSKDREIKLIPEMLNLLGCSKENFINLIKYLNYKSFEKENDTFIKYVPRKMKKINKFKNIKSDNPFEVLNKISFK